MSKARVVYLAHTFAVGGAEEMVLNLVRYLPAEFERAVVCIDRPGPIGEEIRKTGVPFSALGLQPGIRRPLDLSRLQHFIHQTEPTIVHTFLLTASLYGRFAAMLARVPIVIGTEVNIYERKQPLHRLAERWLMRHTDTVVASAESVRTFYLDQIGADPDKVVVIYNAVDWSQLDTTRDRAGIRAEIGVPADAPAAGIIARLTEQKAHRVLFEAMTLRPELNRLHLIVVGDGDLRDDLQSRAERLGLSARIHFVGPRRDLGNLLGAVDMFLMPSLWEGLPLSLVLAMGAGLPVIASRVAGIPEVVHDGESGLLVNPGDARQLADAMARVLDDDSLRLQMSQRARAFVRPRFGVDRFVASTTALYDRLLASKQLSTFATATVDGA
ncbi:MAG TPA: glycosyltransferase [Vicinamibacterales bacterium]|nr:glycosyltransferase [Vicinamibacterales bacterium]